MTFTRKFNARGDRSKYGKRHTPGVMNGLETAYSQMLEGRKLSGEIIDWWFEAFTFKLADDTRYTPDFALIFSDGHMEFIDVKSPAPIDPKSLVKAKVAADKFWMFDFTIDQKQTKKNGGGFKRREF